MHITSDDLFNSMCNGWGSMVCSRQGCSVISHVDIGNRTAQSRLGTRIFNIRKLPLEFTFCIVKNCHMFLLFIKVNYI